MVAVKLDDPIIPKTQKWTVRKIIIWAVKVMKERHYDKS